MWISQNRHERLRQRWLARNASGRRSPTSRQRGLRLTPEQLEDRTVPSSFTAGTVSDLIADINAANAAGGSNTITLVAGTMFTLTAVDNSTDVATGLPVIAANDNLTIAGNGDVIQRSTATGTPRFRLLDVAAGAALTLESLTLQGGLASNLYSFAAQGGAIYSNGSVTVANCTIQNNQASANVNPADGGAIYCTGSLTVQSCTIQNNQASTLDKADGGAIYCTGSLMVQSCTIQNNEAFSAWAAGPGGAEGGGIYSSGTLLVQSSTIQNNSAIGANAVSIGSGASAFGGGIYIGGGTVDLSNVVLDLNSAKGGNGAKGGKTYSTFGHHQSGFPPGNGGNGQGGGLYVASGTVTLLNTTVQNNSATGGEKGGGGASAGLGQGGGLYIDATASVSLDSFTLANVRNNTASTAYPNIYGSCSTS